MACFLVPTAEAIVTTVIKHSLKVKEEKAAANLTPEEARHLEEKPQVPFSRKLGWLTNMLWGGAALLAFEHVWHGEIAPWFPFLTAAGNATDASVMLHEMATVGVSMAILVTAVWGIMVAVSNAQEKRAPKVLAAKASEK